MAALDIKNIVAQMSAAAGGVLKDKWPDARSFAESEFEKLAHTFVSIGEQFAARKINAEQAELLLDIQKNAARTVLLSLEGLAILAVEEAINAALDAVKSAVNTAVGFALL